MKEKLLAALRLKYPKTHAALLERVAETLASTVADETTIDTVASGDGVKNLLTFFQSETDRRLTEGIMTYEKTHKLKDGKPIVVDEPKPDDDPATPAWAKALMKQNQELALKVQTLEKGSVSSDLMKKVEAKLTEGKVPLKFLFGKTIEKEEDVDALVKQATDDFAEVKQELANQGVRIDPPASGVGGGTSATVDAEIQAWASKDAKK